MKKTKRVLIYLNQEELSPKGGPDGYNYNLMQGLQRIEHEKICFAYLHEGKARSAINSHITSIRFHFLRTVLKALKSILAKGKMMYWGSNKASVELQQYDAVHFHRTLDMYRCRESLKNYNGCVILTSHTPVKPEKEIFELLTDFEKKYMRWFYKRLSLIDDYAFQRADYVVFPCKQAEEPYYHTWKNFSKYRLQNSYKIKYLLTGLEARKPVTDRIKFRREYKIPEKAFVISFVGRHTFIKGYEILKKLANILLERDNEIFFLIAGKEEPLKRLEHERWIEVGWTDDPASVIAASDLFILPNIETYFDLVLLEALSLGQIILASKTGGNLYFEKYEENYGILLYESLDDALLKINHVKEMGQDIRHDLSLNNTLLYQREFSVETFAENYVTLLNNLLC